MSENEGRGGGGSKAVWNFSENSSVPSFNRLIVNVYIKLFKDIITLGGNQPPLRANALVQTMDLLLANGHVVVLGVGLGLALGFQSKCIPAASP